MGRGHMVSLCCAWLCEDLTCAGLVIYMIVWGLNVKRKIWLMYSICGCVLLERTYRHVSYIFLYKCLMKQHMIDLPVVYMIVCWFNLRDIQMTHSLHGRATARVENMLTHVWPTLYIAVQALDQLSYDWPVLYVAVQMLEDTENCDGTVL